MTDDDIKEIMSINYKHADFIARDKALYAKLKEIQQRKLKAKILHLNAEKNQNG